MSPISVPVIRYDLFKNEILSTGEKLSKYIKSYCTSCLSKMIEIKLTYIL